MRLERSVWSSTASLIRAAAAPSNLLEWSSFRMQKSEYHLVYWLHPWAMPSPSSASCVTLAPAYDISRVLKLLNAPITMLCVFLAPLFWSLQPGPFRGCIMRSTCSSTATPNIPLWCWLQRREKRCSGPTALHSGHSKLVIFSHCAFVRSMHFGWYLQDAAPASAASCRKLALLQRGPPWCTRLGEAGLQSEYVSISTCQPVGSPTILRIWST